MNILKKLKADRDKFAGMQNQQLQSNMAGEQNLQRLVGITAYLNEEIKKLEEGKDGKRST